MARRRWPAARRSPRRIDAAQNADAAFDLGARAARAYIGDGTIAAIARSARVTGMRARARLTRAIPPQPWSVRTCIPPSCRRKARRFASLRRLRPARRQGCSRSSRSPSASTSRACSSRRASSSSRAGIRRSRCSRTSTTCPVLPPHLAAYLGTGAELVLPVLLALGIGTRFAAIALFVFNIVAVDFVSRLERRRPQGPHAVGRAAARHARLRSRQDRARPLHSTPVTGIDAATADDGPHGFVPAPLVEGRAAETPPSGRRTRPRPETIRRHRASRDSEARSRAARFVSISGPGASTTRRATQVSRPRTVSHSTSFMSVGVTRVALVSAARLLASKARRVGVVGHAQHAIADHRRQRAGDGVGPAFEPRLAAGTQARAGGAKRDPRYGAHEYSPSMASRALPSPDLAPHSAGGVS